MTLQEVNKALDESEEVYPMARTSYTQDEENEPNNICYYLELTRNQFRAIVGQERVPNGDQHSIQI